MKKVIKDESLAETDNASKDAAVRWNPKNGLQVSELINRDIRDAFIAGAKWHEQQMLKDYIPKETVKKIARGSLGVQDFIRKIDKYEEDKQ